MPLMKSTNILIGYPLTHSKSSLLHNAIYAQLGLNAIFETYQDKNLDQALHKIKHEGIELTAVTLPFKQSIVKSLDFLSDEVKSLGAANTIIQRAGSLYGYNTDVDGIKAALNNIKLANKNILIIGAGGGARALAYVLNQAACQLYWYNRTPAHAEQLAEQFGGEVLAEADLSTVPADLIVNTTSVGMYPNIHETFLPYRFKKTQIVFDMVYNPAQTRLLREAALAGCTIISGIEMFLSQALKQIALWQNLPSLEQDKRLSRAELNKLLGIT